jgi:hypothetical protein
MPEMISYVIIFGISIVFLIVVMGGFSSINDNYQVSYASTVSKKICYDIASSVESVKSSNQVSGRIVLDLPDKLGSSNYRIAYSNGSISVLSEKANISCRAQGEIKSTAAGGRIFLDFDTVAGKKYFSIMNG